MAEVFMFLACVSAMFIHLFMRTDTVTTIAHERLDVMNIH